MSFPWSKPRPASPPPSSPPDLPEEEENEWEDVEGGGGSSDEDDDYGRAAVSSSPGPLASHPLSEDEDEAGVRIRQAKTKAVMQPPGGAARQLPPTPVLATALAAALLSVVVFATRRLRRRRRGQAAPPPPPITHRRRRPAVADMQAPPLDVSTWVELVVDAPASSTSGPLAGTRLIVAGPASSATTQPVLAALADAGAALVGAVPDPVDAGAGPLAVQGTPATSSTPNPAVPAGGAALAGAGARAAACLAARAADLALAPSPPTGLPAALGAAAGLAALRTAEATLMAVDVAALPAAAVAAGLAPSGRRPPDAPPTTLIVAEDLFDGCWGEPAAVAALPAAVRAASAAWASPAMVQSAELVPFLTASVPAAAAFVSAEEWEGGAVLRGLRRAAGVLAGEEAVDNGPSPPQAVAEQVSREAADALRRAVGGGHVLVLPSLPGPHPPGGGEGDAAARAAWGAGVRGLAALAGLSSRMPSVSIPVPTGPFPTGVTLLGGPGSTGVLLSAAVRLGPMLAREWGPAADQARAAISQAAAGLVDAAGGGGPPASPSPSAASAATAVPDPPSPATATSAAVQPPAASTAATLRAGGNAAFRAGDFAGAVEAYTAAAAADPSCHLALSNRAAAHLSLLRFEDAEADATASLRLRTTPKALLRRATARRGLGDIPGARADLRTVLQLEPGNAQARSDLAALAAQEEAGLV